MERYYSRILKTKEFKNKDSIQAYMSACKWVANNIVCKVELSNIISYKITKQNDTDLPTYLLTVFINIDLEKAQEEHCKLCKEMANSFYISKETNCDMCKIKGYSRRLELHLKRYAVFYNSVKDDNLYDSYGRVIGEK